MKDDIFDKYNVAYPKNNWTYDEFLQTAQKLTHTPEVYGISFEEEGCSVHRRL